MASRLTDWIWHIDGSLMLSPTRSGDDAFDRLSALFDKPGTTYAREGDTLAFEKRDQAAQDKMSIFDAGVLSLDRGGTGTLLRYRLKSRALLFCFLAPLFFLAIAQLTIAVGKFQEPDKAAHNGKDAASKKPEVKKPDVPMNPIDKALGMPAPDKPKKDKRGDDGDGDGEGGGKKPSPTSAYVFAAMFAVLYVVGRIFEAYLVRGLFTRALGQPGGGGVIAGS